MGSAIPIVSLFSPIAGGILGSRESRKARKQASAQQQRAEARAEEQFRKQEEVVAKQEAKINKAEETQRELFGKQRKSLLAGRFGRRQTFFQGNELGVEGAQGRTTFG